MSASSPPSAAGDSPANRKPGPHAARAGGPIHAVSRVAGLYGQGRYREALHVASDALRREPANADLWNAGAVAALALGLLADAEQFWKVALRHDPECVEAHSNLGTLHARNGNLASAESALQRAVSLDPDHSAALSNLGAALVELGRYEDALRALERSSALSGDSPQTLNNLGLALLNLDRFDEARAVLRRSTALKPDCPEALLRLALVHLREGDESGAIEYFDSVLSIDPANAGAHLFKARQNRTVAGCARVRQLEQAYCRRGGQPVKEAIQLDFAMGKVCEDLGRYEEAFQAYAEGNRLHHARHPFDELAEQRFLDEAISGFGAEVYRQTGPERPACRTQTDSRVPVFIVGMPRSGTTLVEQILATHPRVLGAGELTLLRDLLAPEQIRIAPREQRSAWLRRLREIGDRYLEEAWKRQPEAAFLVDKMPGNYRLLGLIPLMIPQARIIHMNRAPLDVCWSCFTLQFGSGHEYAYDQGTLGRQYMRYHRLMEHWRRIIPEGSMLEVRYEHVVADMEREIRRILDHLGLDWHEDCARFHENRRLVRTASRTQVRRPIYASSIGRWRRFEKQLTPLIRELSALGTGA